MSDSNKLIWTRIDPDGPGLHSPQRDGDCGWDLEAAEDILIPANAIINVPTNVRVKLPPNCWGELRARSSMARSLIQVPATVIDNGYTGHLFVLVHNLNRRPFESDGCDWMGRILIKKGHRIAQLVLHIMAVMGGQEVETLEHDPRRGEKSFGSTGI